MEKERIKTDLENRWWHRLAKIIIYSLSFFIPTINIIKWGYFGNAIFFEIVLIIASSLVIGYILFSLFSIIYYQIILYIIYKKKNNVFSYSFAPIIIVSSFSIIMMLLVLPLLIDFLFEGFIWNSYLFSTENITRYYLLHPMWNIVFCFTILTFFCGLFLFITAKGEEEKKQKAKKMILWSIIGIIIGQMIVFLMLFF